MTLMFIRNRDPQGEIRANYHTKLISHLLRNNSCRYTNILDISIF